MKGLLDRETAAKLQNNMKTLAEDGVSRSMFRALLGLSNNGMTNRAKKADVRFNEQVRASDAEARRLLGEIGIPDAIITTAFQARQELPKKVKSGVLRIYRGEGNGISETGHENAASQEIRGKIDLLRTLINERTPQPEIAEALGETADDIGDFLRKNNLRLLTSFNALPRK